MLRSRPGAIGIEEDDIPIFRFPGVAITSRLSGFALDRALIDRRRGCRRRIRTRRVNRTNFPLLLGMEMTAERKLTLMIIYLIGPSGVGKSNAVCLLRSQAPEVDVVDIDAEFPGQQFDWDAIRPFLTQLHRLPADKHHTVVDVGAGTQTLSEFYDFLREEQPPIVVVFAPHTEVIHRQPVHNRCLEEFLETEYTKRASLYGLATVTVDVAGLSTDESARKIVDSINALQ
jgi:hypothetical protein